MPSLKEGGVLIYSTCSYSKEEDEEICNWLLKEFEVESLKFKVDDAWGVVETVSEMEQAFGYRFYPDKVKGEGFFIAAFKKEHSGEVKNQKPRTKKNTDMLSSKEVEPICSFLKNADDFFFIRQNDEVIAMPIHLQDELTIIQSVLYIKKAGVKLGSIIRAELIPAHDLAVSTIIDPSIRSVELNLETALQYLRRQDIKIDKVENGWALVSFQNLYLGWIKIIGNRINNYYPQTWRILNK